MIAALVPGSASASEPCSRNGDVVTVSLPSDVSVMFVRSGPELVVSLDRQPGTGACAGITDSNTALISVESAPEPSSTPYRDVTVDLSGGGLGGIGIEIAPLGTPKPTLEIIGSTGPDLVAAGTEGIDLGLDDDLDLIFDPTIFEQLHVYADAGDDVVSAAGGRSIGSPIPIHVNLIGNEGDDELTGGSGHDLIDGRDGFDTVAGGLGGDFCWEAEEHRSCENPIQEESPSWFTSCSPGALAADCTGGGGGDHDGGLAGGARLAGRGGLLPASGAVAASGLLAGFTHLDEAARSISIISDHDVSWADIDVRTPAGTASAVLTVRAYHLSCELCSVSVSRTIVDSQGGPTRAQGERFRLNLIMTNGDEPIPPGSILIDVLLTLRAELGVGLVPTTGSISVTATLGLNSVTVYPEQ